jgi:hypothetical protein
MGKIHSPLPTLLFTGMISPDPDLFASCSVLLQREFGPLDFESAVLPWNITDYYQEEMGKNLFRKFLFFKQLIDPDRLPAVKVFTNGIEEQFSVVSHSPCQRRVNLDPGYVTEAKVVLASTKDFAHRIYIGENIYAEVTLRYSGKEQCFTSLDHTYFDFRLEAYKNLFSQARDSLRKGLNR